ncbi:MULTISPECIES: cytochrome ubiquinol oxidase subunit I [Stenotrophomonas]|jgi:cytochrome d ubiquinol oxidase subunit I|uniref:cytochrome ubiquinol oxidase subunit I n=2 Tax=Lysobacteraceae TaxID=32033 RepID=UPI000368886C|nr:MULTISPECIES: cytochrome ubiquinol oxidase subunit I [Stenotrophomonas]MBD3826917.1 cytochrome ubiquinol oxidase subunit I [Stenotrophomonas sp.]QIO88780.1 cytochrome bd oxidase subunit I [Stenotrophomonas rhizophila]HBS63131.1 cytochrome bd-I ubiquinol oxidase subunit CydA [Stenotrophomonas sp.]
MIDQTVVELSRLQFALTAMYHFLFVPLTLGLSFMVAIMESVYVMTRKQVWRQMTLFWGTLFGINFAIGVATGIVMEFQFGMNWSYYSHYVGDIFGAPLAIEGLMAFFLEATFIGLFFFGWKRLTPVKHLTVTWLMALGTNLSAVWILIANGWMQNPTGAIFNPETMRMEVVDFAAVLFNPVAQAKFVHTVSAGYVTGAVFVMSISALYLLRNKHRDMARRSFAVAAAFGLLSSLSVVVLGDESGYAASEHQKMKLAAIEAMWETERAPADFTAFGIPNQQTQQNDYAVKIPYLMGLIATRSFNQPIPGILELVERAEHRVRGGQLAYGALERVRKDKNDVEAREMFDRHWQDLGHGLLLKRYREDILNATPEEISKAAMDTVPRVAPLFWTFRIMAGLGFYLIAFFAVAFYFSCRHNFQDKRWFLKLALWTLPAPWIAIECGWFVAEYGRQPWAVDGVLPTFYAASGLALHEILTTLAVFTALYTVLLVIEVKLMLKAIRKGPDDILPSLQAAATSLSPNAAAPTHGQA